MNRDIFIEKYQSFKLEESKILEYLNTVLAFEKFIEKDIDTTNINDIKKYAEYLISIRQNTYNNLVHIARYYNFVKKSDLYIHMTKYFNSIGVLENILDRITLYESKDKQEEIIKNMELPPFGLDSMLLPTYTKEFMDKLNKYLPRNSCNKILAGNNHRIPKESFSKEKEFYQKSESLEVYLKDRHTRKVAELQKHCDNNSVWFEQIITKEAIEYVKSNQEILSGVVKDDKLYVTKIPYEIEKFLNEENDVLKRYYACHCSFVRENIKDEKEVISKEWCYCSGGFAKYPYEIIFEQDLDVKLLKTPLDGDYVCRFEIDLSNVDYK
jgi:hypothetical protein